LNLLLEEGRAAEEFGVGVRLQRQLEGGALQVHVEQEGVGGVDEGVLAGGSQQILGALHVVLVQGALRHHKHLHQSIRSSIHPSINPSITPSINPSINQFINPSVHPSIHARCTNPSIHQSTNQPIHQSINLSINPSIKQFIN
jgi:hypothetical protein